LTLIIVELKVDVEVDCGRWKEGGMEGKVNAHFATPTSFEF
jgi:hypothetical protein